MSKLVNYKQFEEVFKKIKTYIDDNIQQTRDLSNENTTAYIEAVKEEIFDILANNYASLETFQEYSDALSLSFQLLQYGMNLRFESTGGNINDIYEELVNLKKDIYNNIRFDTAGLAISQNDSPFALDISEKEIIFTENNKEVVKIAGNKLSASNIVADNSLTLGAFRFISKKNGHLSLAWNDEGNLITHSTAYPEKMISATNNTTLHTFQLKNAPVKGQTYTFELCADIPDRDSYYSIYSGSTLVESIYPQEFNTDGIGRKSLRWDHEEPTQLSLRFTGPVGGKDLSITSIKMYTGDEYWDNAYNLLSYNNVWNDSNYIWNDVNKYTVTSKSSSGIYECVTSLYSYLEEDTDYMFSCNVDTDWGFKGYNYIENGKFEKISDVKEGFPSGGILVFIDYRVPTKWDITNPKLLSIYEEQQTPGTLYLTNASTGESDIYQEIHNDKIAPNTEITISFDIDWELNVKDCEAKIEYYDEKNTLMEDETVILNKIDGYIHSGHVEKTITTIDRYSYFRISFVHGGIIDDEADADRLMSISNVKLEKGIGATDSENVDSVYMYLFNMENNERIELASNPFRFRASSAGMWKLCFCILKENATHSFWDAKIAKVEILDEEEFVNEGEEEIYQEGDDL